MNVYFYPFGDNTIDEVLPINILEHFSDIIKVIEEVKRYGESVGMVRALKLKCRIAILQGSVRPR